MANTCRVGIYKIVGMRLHEMSPPELAHTFSTRAGEIPTSREKRVRSKNEGEKERFLEGEREREKGEKGRGRSRA